MSHASGRRFWSIPRRRALKALTIVPLGAGLTACGSTQTGERLRADGAAPSDPDVGGTAAADAAPTAADGAPGVDAQRGPDGQLVATPSCGTGATVAQTEGPYWTANSPQRSVLREAGTAGTKLVLEGFVVSRACQPLANALVDLWQCDDKGVYDNSGFKLRGHTFTDADGRYRFETILPGLYPGRTRHLHVKVRGPGQTAVLTTQLYFPGEAQNTRDGIYNAALLVRLEGTTDKTARFDFVLNV
jgi:protocatechuate 3,4-dioxygenase beta subunit